MRALVAIMVLAIACGTRAGSQGAAASPSASASLSVTPTQAATLTPSPSPTRRPNPTAGPGTYTSLALAYRVDVPAGWRRSSCQSSQIAAVGAIETFTTAPVDSESGSDTGAAQDVVLLRVEDPDGKTPLQWLQSGKMGFSTQSHFEATTFDGKDAARIVTNDTQKTVGITVAARGRMYAASYAFRVPSAEPAAAALMLSLHILSDAELADARASLATPSPVPARSVESVADALAAGFSRQDTAALAAVADDCLSQALENAGAGFMSAPRYLADLRTRFANGLVVTVQPRPIEQTDPGFAMVRGTWREPGRTANVKLLLKKIGETWYWEGVLFLQG